MASHSASDVNNEDIDGSETEIEDLSDIVENKVKKTRLWSSAWNYFNIVDPKRKLAECRRCNLTFTYRSSVGNLMKHVRRRHLSTENTDIEDSNHKANIEKYDEMNIEQLEDLTENEGIFNFKTLEAKPGRSVVWSYFATVDKERRVARCLICSKKLSYSGSISNLRKHMKAKHPLAPLKSNKNTIIVSTGDQLYELETASKDETENVDDNEQSHLMNATYLEKFDPIGDENVSFAPKPIKKSNPKERTKARFVIEDTSDDEVVLKKRYEKKICDSLDYFGKYVVSLLRKLPKEKSDEMQMDIVKRLMEAQAACGAREADVTRNQPDKEITMSGTKFSGQNDSQDNSSLHN